MKGKTELGTRLEGLPLYCTLASEREKEEEKSKARKSTKPPHRHNTGQDSTTQNKSARFPLISTVHNLPTW